MSDLANILVGQIRKVVGHIFCWLQHLYTFFYHYFQYYLQPQKLMLGFGVTVLLANYRIESQLNTTAWLGQIEVGYLNFVLWYNKPLQNCNYCFGKRNYKTWATCCFHFCLISGYKFVNLYIYNLFACTLFLDWERWGIPTTCHWIQKRPVFSG